jgi:hypothetical protein
MKNRYISFTILLLPVMCVHAQENKPSFPWKRKLQAGFNINQAAFSDNWKAGGVSSVAGTALFNVNINYSQPAFEWANDLQTSYGTVKSKGTGVRKSADRIFFESKYAYKLTSTWRLFASLTFMSQFDDGFDYKTNTNGEDSNTRISSFLSPGYLTEAVGVEYKPVEWFSAQFGLGALRQTFVIDQELYKGATTTLYGVDKGKYVRNQVVFQLVAEVNKEIMKNVTLKARYMGVADYTNVNKSGIVHRLDLNIIAKVNRYINTSFGAVVLFDPDQDKDEQYSQLLNIGILYTFQNFEEKK